MSWLKPLLEVLALLGQLTQRVLRRREQRQAQADRDALEQDPKRWLAIHFNGMPDQPQQAADADQAHPKHDPD